MFGVGPYKKVSVVYGLAMLFYGGAFIVSAMNDPAARCGVSRQECKEVLPRCKHRGIL